MTQQSETISRYLQHSFLFKNVTEYQRDDIANASTLVRLKRGETLFVQGDEATAFFAIAVGKVAVSRTSGTGAEQIIHILKEYEFIAEAAIFGLGKYPANAKALIDSTIIKIPKQFFIDYILSHPQVSLGIMAGYSERLREFVMMIEYLSLDDVKLRLLKYMQRNGRPTEQGVEVRLGMTKKEWAGLLGTTPESLSRNLKKLKDENLLKELESGELIVNPLAFKQLLQE